MKTYLRILVILILVSSCQENKKEGSNLNTKIIKEKTSNKKEAIKNQNPKKILTKAQYEEFFQKN